MIITLKDGNIEAEIESVGARINVLRINGVDILYGTLLSKQSPSFSIKHRVCRNVG